MAVKQSTGLRDAIARAIRELYEDFVIRVFSGTAPASGNDAQTGTLLVTLSKASGTVSPGEVGTPKEAKVEVASHASGETFSVTINGTEYAYINTPDLDAIPVAAALAALIDADPLVEAHAGGTVNIYVRSRIAGITFTITVGGTGTLNLTDDAVANVDADTINFDAPVAGVLSKPSDIWSGVAVAAGTAGYFRIVKSDDDGTQSTTQPRLQGNVATSGQELTMTPTTQIALGATISVPSAAITVPASA